jgi:hypothetical protein
MNKTPRTFKEDHANGLKNEQDHKSFLEEAFGSPLTKDTNPYAAFDFFNETKTMFVELKCRGIDHDRWPTALISANKVAFAKRGLKEDPTKRYYFVWIYRDGIYYLPYEEELWSAFETGEFQRNERADRTEVPCATTFIPHQALLRYEGPITQ